MTRSRLTQETLRESEQLARGFSEACVGGRNHDFKKFQTLRTTRVTMASLFDCVTSGTASCAATLTVEGAAAALRGIDA